VRRLPAATIALEREGKHVPSGSSDCAAAIPFSSSSSEAAGAGSSPSFRLKSEGVDVQQSFSH